VFLAAAGFGGIGEIGDVGRLARGVSGSVRLSFGGGLGALFWLRNPFCPWLLIGGRMVVWLRLGRGGVSWLRGLG
jgi:hypothetical protein